MIISSFDVSLRNYRVIVDEATIEYKLHKQFLIAQLHRNDKPTDPSLSGRFAYSLPKKPSYFDFLFKNPTAPPQLHTIPNLPICDELSCTIEVAQFIGRKESQEDTFIASSFKMPTPAGKTHTVLLTGIFDGHGGDGVALYMKGNLSKKLEDTFSMLFNKTLREGHPLKELENEKTLSDKVIWNVLKIICVELHDEYTSLLGGGTTAAFSLLIDGEDLWHANVGDSRSIITSKEKTIQLSEDMKIRFNFPLGATEDKFAKLESSPEYEGAYPLRNSFERSIWKRRGFCKDGFTSGNPRLNGRLSMARSIGDKQNGLCPRPKIVKISLAKEFPTSDSCLLLHASDGLWDIATTDQVADGINGDTSSPLNEVAANLARSAIECDDFDNTSVVLTRLDLRTLRTARETK